jgi:hypothetical protein
MKLFIFRDFQHHFFFGRWLEFITKCLSTNTLNSKLISVKKLYKIFYSAHKFIIFVVFLELKKEVIMPGLDRTGPTGAGPMTGRQLGRCAGNVEDFPGRGYRNFRYGFRRGFGRGVGRGFGFRWGNPFGYYPENFVPDVSDETLLENEARTLKDQLTRVEKELEKIRKGKGEE